MVFQLARHLLHSASVPHRGPRLAHGSPSSFPAPQFGELADAGAAVPSLLANLFQAVSLPGLSGALPTTAGAEPADASGPQQLKTLQDTYSLMSGQGINVNVQNLDLQSRFAS